MGLFSFAKGILKAVPIVGDAISAGDSKKAVGKANAATQLGITNAKGDLNAQLAASQGRLDTYETAGTDALSQIRGILGLNGNDAQAASVAALQNSPLFKSLMRGGQDILLNNASATGGLRGGNFERGLADFSSDTLAQTIQQMIGNWSGLSTAGQNATEFGAGLGQNNANMLAGLDTGSGQSNAGAILGKQSIDNNLFSGIRQQIQQAAMAAAGVPPTGAGGGDISSLLSALLRPGGATPPFSGSGSGYGASGGALPNFPKINIALPSSSVGLPGF